MFLDTLEVGPVITNCYLIGCPETKEGMVIDPGGDPDGILSMIEASGLRVVQILNTHGHADHMAANAAVQKALGCRILVHEADAAMITSRESSLLDWIPGGEPSPQADRLLSDGDTVELGTLTFRVLHLPGHTPGGIGLLDEEVLFSGDTLFALSIGRTDLPGASEEIMFDTLARRIATLDDNLKVYPGHGPATTIGREKRENPFLRMAMRKDE
ncbi:MAG: MBL fold metallo-hydrolase [Candidatus Eisenbacteria sp.]|nr:MBL fold metallo-hydrolase [Candidatus Eisenbacteria bacterium]